jgi:hypothetical protein
MTPRECNNCNNHKQGEITPLCRSCLNTITPNFPYWSPTMALVGCSTCEYNENLGSEPPCVDCSLVGNGHIYGWKAKTDTVAVIKVDEINNPSHYTKGGIEAIDYMKAKLTREEFIGYLRGSCMKYLSRLGEKDSRSKDSAKAAWYAKRLEAELNA